MSLLIDIYKTQAAEHPDGPELQIDVAYGYGNLGDTELEQGDKAAALLDLRRAVDIARQFGAKDAGGVGAQMVVADALDDLAQIPGSGVSWAEVAARFQAMKDRGQLPADRQAEFVEVKRHAAEEAKAKQAVAGAR